MEYMLVIKFRFLYNISITLPAGEVDGIQPENLELWD